MAKFVRRIIRVVVLLVVLAAAVAVVVIAVPLTKYPARESATIENATVQAVARSTVLDTAATARLEWSPARSVVSNAGSTGTVTAVHASDGGEVACGAGVYDVDGAGVLAYCGAQPLWRPISSTTQGSDVDGLVAYFRMLGLLPPNESPPTSADLRGAIRSFQALSGRRETGELDPAGLLWIGAEAFTPTSVSIQAGQFVSGAVEVLVVEPHVVGATVSIPESTVSTDGDRAYDWAFSIADGQVALPVASDGRIGDISGLVAAAGGQLDATESRLPVTVTGTIALATPIQAIAVPSSAVLQSPRGTCVLDLSGTPRTVTVVDAGVQAVLVVGDIAVGDELQSLPPASATC